jgi:hypothetical protein
MPESHPSTENVHTCVSTGPAQAAGGGPAGGVARRGRVRSSAT